MNTVRVLLFAVAPAAGPEAVELAHHTISEELAETPGLLSNELLRDAHDPNRFLVLSEWESMPAFIAWEQSTSHRPTTAPMRPYQDPTLPARIFEVVAMWRTGYDAPPHPLADRAEASAPAENR